MTRADIGIAIGAGTDIAIESADVVLMKDSLDDVAAAIDLSRAVVRNIHMNLFWAFFYNVLGIPLAAGVLYPAFRLRLSPMIGSAAMSLSLRVRGDQRPALAVLQTQRRATCGEKRHPALGKLSHIDTDNQAEPVEEIPQEPENEKGSSEMKKVLTVEGMMCAHCQAHVQKALAGVEGVTEAVVDLESKEATVTLAQDVADQVLMDAVTEAGYTPVSCETLA